MKLSAMSKKMSDGSAKAEDKEDGSDSELWTAFAFAGIDTDDMCQAMRELAPAVIKIGGEHDFKASHWDSLDMDDQDKIVGVYLQNFLVS